MIQQFCGHGVDLFFQQPFEELKKLGGQPEGQALQLVGPPMPPCRSAPDSIQLYSKTRLISFVYTGQNYKKFSAMLEEITCWNNFYYFHLTKKKCERLLKQ